MSSKSIGLTDALHSYVMLTGIREDAILEALRHETAEHEASRMQISPEQGQFMRLLAKVLGVKRYLEIGTFTGYSSLCIALETDDDTRLVCCDISEEYTATARRYWERAGVTHKIDLRIAPAVDTLDAMIESGAEPFDLAFIDADKARHTDYYERCMKLVRPGGIIAIDNALWGGRVLDPVDEDDHAIVALNRFIQSDERVMPSLLPIGDGLMLAMVR